MDQRAGHRSVVPGFGPRPVHPLWPNLRTLLRATSFAGPVPAVRRRAAEYVACFDEIVVPLIEDAITDRDRRAHTTAALRAAGTKLAFLVAGYAATARLPARADLCMLAGVITRAYDDLLDDLGGAALDDRLAELFSGGDFSPACDVEKLFHSVYREVERRLGRPHDDPVFAALRRLHEFQVRSRRQRDPGIPPGELTEITLGKGGYGTVVLFGLIRPAMSERELVLVRDLGGVLQQLDDYQDAELDRRAGVTTAATRGELTLRDIHRRLRDIRPALDAYYGSVRPLYAILFVYLCFSFSRRRWPRLGTGGTTARNPLGVLLRPGDNLGQKAEDRHKQ